MFVSSYNTYIQTNASEKSVKNRENSSKESSSFSSKLLDSPKFDLLFTSDLPVDYIYKAKSFNTKLELQRQEEALKNPENEFVAKSKELTKEFMGNKTLQNAKSAYEDNSKIFSLIRKPHAPLDQTPQTDSRLPANVQQLQELYLRKTMVNTYAQNDKYYNITAA
ncbi:MAG: hypothetical protein NTW78_09510 [Campylobacterales bacterium]|nr:hypothetical protein [Campylobacterales bacterium]